MLPGLARRLRAGVHRHAHVRLRERRGVVRAVPGHRDEPPVGLLLADELELALRRRLGEDVVDARLLGDRRRGQPVVAGDHDGADAHRPQLVEARPHALLDDVAQLDDPEHLRVARDGQRRRAGAADAVQATSSSGGACPPSSVTQRMTASPAPLRSREPSRSTPLMRVCAVNGTNVAACGSELVLAQPVLLGQHDDRAALRRLVGQRGELRHLREVALRHAGHRDERGGLPVAERDRAGLVEQQDVDVAGRLDRAARRAPARCAARAGPCRRCRSRTAARRSSSG